MNKMIFAAFATVLLSFGANAQTRKPVPARKMVTPSYQTPATYSSSTWGHSFLNELDLNMSAGYLKSYKVGTKSYTDLTLFASYSYDIGHQIQVGGDAGLQSFDSTTRLTAVGTGTYNMDANYADSIYFKAGLGLYPVDKGTLTSSEIKTEFGLYVAAGKRFKIWDHVNYKPQVMIAKISDLDAQITVQFLNVSVNWE